MRIASNTILIFMLLFYLLFISCQKTNEKPSLKIIKNYSLDIKEPSGLCKAWNKNEFLIVSDHSNTIFRINDNGIVLREYSFKGNDLEGVAYEETGKIIWVVNEEKNMLSKINKNGELQKEYLLKYQDHPSNKGLEGITINTTNNHLFMLNEASPGLLLEFFNGQIINSTSLSFAPDYSGIFYEETEDKLWIISDEAKSIYKCDLKGNLLHTYDHTIDKAEGIVVIENNIWLVSDSQNKLYKLEIEKK